MSRAAVSVRSVRVPVRLGSILIFAVCLGVGSLVTPCAVSAQNGGQPSPQRSAEKRDHSSTARELVEGSREAAGEDDAAEFKHSSSVQLLAKITGLSLQHAYWLGVLLNFGILTGLILWLGKKSLPGFFRGRTAAIQKAMADARAASEDANRRLAEIESRLARLDTEIGSMRAAADKDVAAEEERIRAAAAEDVRKVVASAEQEIAAAAKAARRELTAFAADLAVALAKKQVRVDDATDQALVRGFAQELAGNSHKRKDQN